MIDQGIIKHTSGNVTLNEDGSISAANGNFIITKSGNLIAKNADISGSISANVFSSEFINIEDCYNDKIKGYLADSVTGLNIIINRPEELNGPEGNIILNLEESTTSGATANIFIPACKSDINEWIIIQGYHYAGGNSFIKTTINNFGYDFNLKQEKTYGAIRISYLCAYYITFTNINKTWYLTDTRGLPNNYFEFI